jgi:hypothetical protein
MGCARIADGGALSPGCRNRTLKTRTLKPDGAPGWGWRGGEDGVEWGRFRMPLQWEGDAVVSDDDGMAMLSDGEHRCCFPSRRFLMKCIGVASAMLPYGVVRKDGHAVG